MKREHKRDLVVIVGSLLGVAAGYGWRHPDAAAAEAPGVDPLAPSADAAPLVTASSLFAAATLSQRVGEMLRVRPDNLAAQAVLAFAIGAGLSYHADTLGAYIPGLRSGKKR